jgi:hypothetical protein
MDDLLQFLERYQSGSLNHQLDEDLRVLGALLRCGQAEMAGTFSKTEAMAIVDSYMGTWLGDQYTIAERPRLSLYHHIDDSIKLDGLDEKWEIDGPGLLVKIDALSHMGAMGVYHAVRICQSRDVLDFELKVRQAFGVRED